MSRSVRSYVMTLVLLAALSLAADQASGAERVEVGQSAPDFTLPDLDGRQLTTSTLRGEKNLLLVFFRGAW